MNGDLTPAQMREEQARVARPLPPPDPYESGKFEQFFDTLSKVAVGEPGRRQGSLWDIAGNSPVGEALAVGVMLPKNTGVLLQRLAQFVQKGQSTRGTYLPKRKEIADLFGLTPEEAVDPNAIKEAMREVVKRVHPDKLALDPETTGLQPPNLGALTDLVDRYLYGAGRTTTEEAFNALGVRFSKVFKQSPNKPTPGATRTGGGGAYYVPEPEVELKRLYDTFGPNAPNPLGTTDLRAVTNFERQLHHAANTLMKMLEKQGGAPSADIEDWVKAVTMPNARHLADINQAFRQLYERQRGILGQQRLERDRMLKAKPPDEPPTQVRPPEAQ